MAIIETAQKLRASAVLEQHLRAGGRKELQKPGFLESACLLHQHRMATAADANVCLQ